MAGDATNLSTQLVNLTKSFFTLNFMGQAIVVALLCSSLPFVIPALFLAAFLAIPIKLYLKLTTGVNRSQNRLDGKTVLLTGGSSGVGKEIAYDLAQRGARVVIAEKNPEKAQPIAEDIIRKTKNDRVVVKKVDLSIMADVKSFANEFQSNERRLDILINNAGVTTWSRDVNLTPEKLEKQMASNYFGHFLLTHLLLDMLRNSSGRIINAASVLHWRVYSLDLDNLDFHKGAGTLLEIYSVSKLCMILFTRLLSKRLKDTGVTVNCYHPGMVDTPMYDQDKSWANILLWLPRKFFFKSPFQGAQTPLYLATSPDVENVTGEYFADCKVSKTSMLAQNMTLAEKLWDKTEAILDKVE